MKKNLNVTYRFKLALEIGRYKGLPSTTYSAKSNKTMGMQVADIMDNIAKPCTLQLRRLCSSGGY